MDTFKQLMGFALLGTVVYLFTFMDRDYMVPTLALLVGLWVACWWIGRTPLYADLNKRVLAWGQGAAVAALVGWFAFTWLVPRPALLPWQPYSRPELARLASENCTVMVDFTAEWCPNCKWNLHYVINTEDVRDAVDAGGIVPLVADWTHPSPEIKDMLEALGSNSIPVLAIFPASRPNEPIVLYDLLSKREILDALKKAGPSANAASPVTTASLGGP
jgi:thiol:disulfide interchange protein